jgi:hypothetical protein
MHLRIWLLTLLLAGQSISVFGQTPAAPATGQDSEVPSPRYVEIAELGPHHDKQEVTMTFIIEEEYEISGTVPVGQVRSFGIRPKLNRDVPQLNVLVMGDLANIMYRFGFGTNRAKGVVIRATGKITVFPAPNGEPDKQPTYQLNISDWKKFRIIPDPNPNKA